METRRFGQKKKKRWKKQKVGENEGKLLENCGKKGEKKGRV